MRTRLKAISLLSLTIGLAVGATPALAHALIVRSSPAANAVLATPPAQIELIFSEGLEPSFSTIQVLNTAGARVDAGDASVDVTDPTRMTASLRSLPDGVYTVTWKALSSVDGHLTSGAFPFAVGNVDAAALATVQSSQPAVGNGGHVHAESTSRWLIYLTLALIVGGFVFTAVVWEPAYAGESRQAALTRAFELVERRLASAALAVFLAANALSLMIQAGNISGELLAAPWSEALSQVLFSTRFGALWIIRVGLAFGLAPLLLGAHTHVRRWITVVVFLLLIVSISLGAHAAAEANPALPVAADAIHLLAAAVWVGGLIYFFAALSLILTVSPGDRTPLVARLIPRFSGVALPCVAAITTTGLYSAVLRVGSLPALVDSDYGRVLVIKSLIVLPLVALGAVNLLFYTPRMKQAAAAGGDLKLVQKFHAGVQTELVLGTVLLFSVGVLTSLAPPRAANSARLTFATRAEDLRLQLDITPGRVGVNAFALTLRTDSGPLTVAKAVELRFTSPIAGGDAVRVPLIPAGDGRYTTEGAYLSLPDAWQVQAVVRRVDQFDVFANFDVDLSPNRQAGVPWTRVNGALLWLVAPAMLAALWSVELCRRLMMPAAVIAALAVGVVGALVYARPLPVGMLINPIPPGKASTIKGQVLYLQNCEMCHGKSGKGDGPVGLTLNPRPADLTYHALPGVHPDGQLYDWISNGFAGSVMPAFRDRLSDEDRWNLVNYLRTLPYQQP